MSAVELTELQVAESRKHVPRQAFRVVLDGVRLFVGGEFQRKSLAFMLARSACGSTGSSAGAPAVTAPEWRRVWAAYHAPQRAA